MRGCATVARPLHDDPSARQVEEYWLNEAQASRTFVLAMAADPFGSATAWARAAGDSDKSEAAKLRGSELLRDPKVEAAIFELANRCCTHAGFAGNRGVTAHSSESETQTTSESG